jgi:hypothetical protein
MASEKAQSIHRAYLNGCALVGVIVREDILHGAVDAELAEVREVLEGIRGFYGTAQKTTRRILGTVNALAPCTRD